MDNLNEILKKTYDSLPENIKEAVGSADVANEVQEIGKRYQIHIDKLGHLYDEVTMVMLGLEEPNELEESLKRKLGLTEEKITELIKDINNKIFEPIRESLKEMYPEDKEISSSEIPNKYPQTSEGILIENKPKALLLGKNSGEVVTEHKTTNLIENKLNNTVRTETKDVILNKPNEEKESKNRKYIMDPYKEPLE